MSLILDIQDHLTTMGVTKVAVDRDSDISGSPATEVRVWVDANHDGTVVKTEHVFQFSKANNLGAKGMAAIIDSYVENTDGALA